MVSAREPKPEDFACAYCGAKPGEPCHKGKPPKEGPDTRPTAPAHGARLSLFHETLPRWRAWNDRTPAGAP